MNKIQENESCDYSVKTKKIIKSNKFNKLELT